MLVSFTGAQCTGKSTLLKRCKVELPRHDKMFEYVPEVTRKVGRMGHVINEDGDDTTQLFILKEHLENHIMRLGDAILDRCILDGYVYTHWLYKNDKVSKWVSDYSRCLLSHLGSKLDVIFYTEPDDIKIEDDGERSVDSQFRDDIIDIYEDILENSGSISGVHTWRSKVVRLTGDVDTRMQTILTTINNE